MNEEIIVMRELTGDRIRKWKESYRSNGANPEWTQKYRTRAISDLAFEEEKAALHKFEFSVDLPTMNAISQGHAGRCWIIAGLNMLREKAVQKMDQNLLPNGELAFSAAYLCFWDKIEKSNCFLEKVMQTINDPYDQPQVFSWFQYAVTDGGFWTCFSDLVRKYGLVPAEIMPETYQSSNTEELNNRLNYYIRKTGADMRNASRQGKNIEEICQIKDRAMNRIFTFLCRCYGCPPEAFSYTVPFSSCEIHEKRYTPASFYQEVLEGFVEDFINVISLPYDELPFGEMCALDDVFKVVGMHDEIFLNLELEKLKAFCIQQLKDGMPVLCTADDDKMCRDELQLWDDGSFDYEEVTGFSFDMSRRDYFQLKAGSACHSMLITGVHIADGGKVQRWKIENSYGINGLHKGYFTCSDSWFNQYMVSAVIHKKYLGQYQKKITEKTNLFHIQDIL